MEILVVGIIAALFIFGAIAVVLLFVVRKLFIVVPAKILHSFVEEQARSIDAVDPDAPIHPSRERKSSEYMAELAVQAKSDPAPDATINAQLAAQPTRPPQRVQKTVPIMPQDQQNLAPSIPANPNMNPLVENDMPQQPVIDPQAANAHIDVTMGDLQDLADDNVYIPPKSDKLEYGVRDASYSPNRILRDKRYRRNSAN